MMAERGDITQLLQAWKDGRTEALEQLIPLVYPDLHRLARRHMAGERDDHDHVMDAARHRS